MGLNDLLLEIKQDPSSFLGDEATENKVGAPLTMIDCVALISSMDVKCCNTSSHVKYRPITSQAPNDSLRTEAAGGRPSAGAPV